MPESKKFELSPSVSIIVAGVLVAGAIVFVNLNPSQPTVALGEPTVQVDIAPPNAGDYILGAQSAPIVLIEYSDFQCPYCAMIHPTLKQIVAESDGEVAWVYRHLPLESLHPQAFPSALAAECIGEQLGQSGFWAFADDVFADQSGMNSVRYQALAGRLGANIEQFNACVESEKYLSKIETQALDAQSSGGTGTPFTVVLNTETGKTGVVPGAVPYARVQSVINSVR